MCALASALAVLSTPSKADACGGLFCDAGTQMPVDQAEEQVLFVRDGSDMEVHIRVLYSGEAENFAWVIPVLTTGTPSFDVGSDPLFAALDVASSRKFVVENTGGSDECGGWNDGGSSSGFVNTDSAVEPPTVEAEGEVGSFEFAVLSGGTAASVMQWLDDNGFAQDPDAEPVLEDYLARGHKFAAVKLSASADAQAIHPIVVRFPGDEACVPLLLTAIAAEEDMGVVTYALDTERLAPLNYRHVVPNLLRLQSWTAAAYDEVLSLAVDEASGRAFATDYYGTSANVNDGLVYNSSWNPSFFDDLPPQQVTQALLDMDLRGQPLLVPILREFLPAPAGIPEFEFWNNLEGYSDQIDLLAWDGPGFGQRLDELIFAPGLHASMLLEEWPKLTRLSTIISPHEMTSDPVFVYRDDLPEVDNLHTAVRVSECDERGLWTAEGQTLCENDYDVWPRPGLVEGGQMPFAQRIESIPMVGAPQVTVDNQALIDAAAAVWNEATCVDGGGGDETSGSSDGSGTDGDTGTGSSSGTSTDGDSTSDGAGSNGINRSGCACAAVDGGGPGGGRGFGILALLGLVGLRRTRRRSA